MDDGTPSAHLPTRWTRDPDVLHRPVEDETVVLHVPSSVASTLDLVATAVWGILDEPRAESELVAMLSKSFAGDPAVIAVDVVTLLADLESRSLIRRC